MKMRLQILPVILVLGLSGTWSQARFRTSPKLRTYRSASAIGFTRPIKLRTLFQFTILQVIVWWGCSGRGDVTPQNLSPLYSRGRIIAGRGHWSRVPPRRGAALRDSPGLLDSGSAKRRQLTEFFAARLAEIPQGVQRAAIQHRAQLWHGLIR